jgi:hypothetical protein
LAMSKRGRPASKAEGVKDGKMAFGDIFFFPRCFLGLARLVMVTACIGLFSPRVT